MTIRTQVIDRTAKGALGGDESTQPMRWALDASRKAVHVAFLSREQTGLNCSCSCPACGGRLQAVNAGRGPDSHSRPNSLGQFFRHHTGIQREGCLSAAARIAALQLLVQHGQIDLPPPSVTSTRNGLSGEAYTASAVGQPYRARILSRHWIDEQAATLTLDDGRVILVHMRTSSGFEAGGKWDAVLTIQVSDPDVAGWPAEQILQQISLNPDFTCWERHWQHAELARQASAEAQQLAGQAGDVTPSELAYDGETPPGAEGVLHWVVKKLLAKVGRIRVPALSETIESELPDVQWFSQTATVPATVLELRDVRVEHRLPGLVPDVICMARDTTGKRGEFELLVEIAVTHKVDQAKLQKIRALNLACLELDATRFNVGGRVRVGDLSSEVVTSTRNKRWLHHPQLAVEVALAKGELRRQMAQVRDAMRAQEEAQAWLSSQPANTLREYYLLSVDLPSGDLILEGRPWQKAAFAHALAARGWPSANDSMLTGEGGMVRCIASIKRCAAGAGVDMTEVFDSFDRFLLNRQYQAFATLVSIAFKVYAPPLSATKCARLDEINDAIKASIKARELTYGRPGTHDKFVAFLFPEMAEALTHPFGTREQIQDERRRERLQELRREEVHRAIEAEKQREHEAQLEKKAVQSQIAAACRFGWQSPLGFTRDADQILSLADVKALSRANARHSLDVPSIIRSACQARADGVGLESWFKAQGPATAELVSILLTILRTAWLVGLESPRPRR